MRLRNQLLLLALVVLVVPWAGWQFVRGLEARLRDGQAAALADSAGVLAGALRAADPDLPPPGPVLFVHSAAQPITPDGDDADWRAQRAFAQATDADAVLQVALARYGGALHLLAEVRDATRVRRAPDADGDALRLLLDDGTRVHALRIGAAHPGRAQVIAEGVTDAGADGIAEDGNRGTAEGAAGDRTAPMRVEAAWQEIAQGYRVELRLPGGALPRRLGIEAVDRRQDGSTARHGTGPDRIHGLWPLVQRSEGLSRQLAAMLPHGLRARVLHPDGWVLAEAGALAAPVAPDAPRWLRALYALTAEDAPTSTGPAEHVRVPPALLAPALDGTAVTRWRRDGPGVQLHLGAIVPLPAHGDAGPPALLALERRSDAALIAQRALSGLLGASVLALVVVAAALFAYASWLGLRVRRLGRAVDAAMLAERGAPVAFRASDARDEIGELSRRFQRLLEEVASHTEYLRTLASKLSHELHTPLAIVRGSLDNLDAQSLPSDARTYLERARSGSERLGAIIRAMSEATRVERAIAAADAEAFDLRAFVHACAESYRPLVAPRRLLLQLPEDPLPLHGAPELLAQALDKLVDNARGFCPEDGWVRIALAPGADGAELRVANAGPPLPDTAPARLFDSLVSLRARGARQDGTPHLGLGLHIVRLIAELHRGEASARNLPDGTGVEFRLRLRGMPA